MVRATVSRGLFAEDSFDRVFADGENSKRFREKRVSFSRLSHDTLSAVRKIKRARRTCAERELCQVLFLLTRLAVSLFSFLFFFAAPFTVCSDFLHVG